MIGAPPLRPPLVLFTSLRALSPHAVTLGVEALVCELGGGRGRHNSLHNIPPSAPPSTHVLIYEIKHVYPISTAPKVLKYSSINSKVSSEYLKLSLGETRSVIYPEAEL